MMAFLKSALGLGLNPLHALILAAVIFASGLGLGTAGGWTANGWRLSGEIQKQNTTIAQLQGANAAFDAANTRCGKDVADVKTGVAAVLADAKRVNDRALKAVEAVAGKAADHQRQAMEALNREPVLPEQWCAALQKELGAYAARRRP